VLTFHDFEDADEVFLTGNMAKITPVKAIEDKNYQIGPVTRRLRDMYWDWAASEVLYLGLVRRAHENGPHLGRRCRIQRAAHDFFRRPQP
jgi:hypothetical protein